MDFTIVVGVDVKHLQQFLWVYPTWIKHKPGLLNCPLLMFVDREDLTTREVRPLIKHPDKRVVAWPPKYVHYDGDYESKWYNPQRYKMLAGFVHVPATFVDTPYWLKLDTDTVATGAPGWVDPHWFDEAPAIISQGWHYTKPPNQMVQLDRWASLNGLFSDTEPLNLVPKEGDNKVKHKRIISWCAFFNTKATRNASADANLTCGDYKLPVHSQDGYVWYHARRSGRVIRRVDMKGRGWKHCTGSKTILNAVKESMQ